MADITAADVKRLREATGAGMMDCKNALTEADGDFDKAVDILRQKNLAGVEKRAGRAANQGRVDSYIHFNNTVGVLIEVNSETDFVANTDEFKQLVRDLALHIASPRRHLGSSGARSSRTPTSRTSVRSSRSRPRSWASRTTSWRRSSRASSTRTTRTTSCWSSRS